MVPQGLDEVAPEEQHSIYPILRLGGVAHTDGVFEVSGAIRSSFTFCGLESIRK
jgi:hypothetical protein